MICSVTGWLVLKALHMEGSLVDVQRTRIKQEPCFHSDAPGWLHAAQRSEHFPYGRLKHSHTRYLRSVMASRRRALPMHDVAADRLRRAKGMPSGVQLHSIHSS